MTLVEYNLALHYALETYVRRDVLYIMSKIYGGKEKNSGKEGTTIVIPQPEIEQWIQEQYENEDDIEDG